MQDIIEKYGPEWALLEVVAKKDSNFIAEATDIIDNYEIHWGELMEQAMSHKMFPMVCSCFMEDMLFEKLPPFINQYFTLNYQINVHKTQRIKVQTLRIVDAMRKEGIDIVCTKGIVLDVQLYEGKGYRFLSDVDFMAMPENKKEIDSIIQSLGFKVGTVDWRNNTIKKLDRSQYLMYLNTKDKLPEYVIEIDDPLIRYVSVGVVFSFTWEKCPYQIPVEEAFVKRGERPLCKSSELTVPVLDNAYHFIYIILHLYKHAWLEHLHKWRNDVNLVKFADVYHFWHANEAELRKTLPAVLKHHNIAEPIMWTLIHTDSIFDSHMAKELMVECELTEEYLHSSGDKSGNTRNWKGSMRERLWSKKRETLFS